MTLKGRPDSGKEFFIQKMASRLRKPFFRSKKGLPDAGKRFYLQKMASRLGKPFFCSKMPVPRRERHMKTLCRVLFRDVSSEKL